MLSQANGSHDHNIIPSMSRANIKWLNINLVLNGRQMPKEKAYVNGSRPHSSIIPCLIGPNAIFVCPSYQRFLIKLDNVAYHY